MKTPAIIGTLAATAAFATTGCAMDFQADTFKTKEGKAVTITAIKHASLRIQYDGLEIQVDPVSKYVPETDYSKFPKADVILVTHEHFDHFDREHLPEIPRHGSIARAMLDAWVAESRKEGSADNENRKVSDL